MSSAPERATAFNKPIITWATCVLIGALAFVHLFITFRGQDRPAVMDQAQIARELVRSHRFQTKVLRPSAITQAATHGVEVKLSAMPETLHPPLQSAVLAPLFYLLKDHWEMEPKRSIYLLDRAIACLGVAFFVLTLVFVHGLARRLFDRTVAGIAVLCLVLSEPMWELATNGGARILLTLLMTLAFYWLALITIRAKANEPIGFGQVAGLSICSGLLVLTHWGGLWLVFGLVFGMLLLLPGHRGIAIAVLLVTLACTGGWMLHNKAAVGDYFGASRPILEGLLSGQSEIQRWRDFDDAAPPAYLGALLRRLSTHSVIQLHELFEHLAFVLPAMFFFVSLLHRFRREDTMKVRGTVLLVWFFAFIGMSMVGLADKGRDDNQLYCALVPTLTVFGVAGMAVFWARLQPGAGGFWTTHGYAIVAIVISGATLITSFSSDIRLGFSFLNQLQQWPPYNASSTAELKKVLKPHHLLASDAPWAMAWYADHGCVWLPRTRKQLESLRLLASKQSTPVVGAVITPLATQGSELASIRGGAFGEWADVLFRGPMMAFEKLDLLKITNSEFPFQEGIPLGYLSGLEKSQTPAMMFYTTKSLLEQ